MKKVAQSISKKTSVHRVRMKINHKCLSGTGISNFVDLQLVLDHLPFHAVSICTFAGYRVAEVAGRREGPSPKSLDSDANFKP